MAIPFSLFVAEWVILGDTIRLISLFSLTPSHSYLYGILCIRRLSKQHVYWIMIDWPS